MALWQKVRDFVLGTEIKMNIEHIKTATEFLAWQDSLGHWDSWTGAQRDERDRIFKTLSEGDRYLVQRRGVEDRFDERQRVPKHQKVYPSTSGKYKLVADSYSTGKGSWNYTCGRLYTQEDDALIAEVKRNYGSFPFMWMEGHPDGHDYLICGEDYQGQTFVQLDTGKVRNLIPDEAFEGFGFCWASYKLLSPTLLLVDGCFWACPYEYRVFDVSNPVEGWPELKFPEDAPYIDSDGEVTLSPEGHLVWQTYNPIHKESGKTHRELSFEWQKKLSAHSKAKHLGASEEELTRLKAAYEAAYIDDWEDIVEEGREGEWDRAVQERVTFKLDGGKLTALEHFKSEGLLEQERRRLEWSQKRKAEVREMQERCPLYQAILEKVGGDMEGRESHSYPSQVMRWDGDENPFYFRVQLRGRTASRRDHTATVCWGAKHGPLTLENWTYGKGSMKTEFPRTLEGLRQAWEEGEAHLASEPGGESCG